jgi:hypothetical protein
MGPGGMGKTTVALAAAERLRAHRASNRSCIQTKDGWVDSTGRRNTFNQGGVYGPTCGLDAQVDGAWCDALAWSTVAATGSGTTVLAADCHRNHEREGR